MARTPGNANAESAFTFIPRGAAIQEFKVAGHNIVQNFPEAALYAAVDHPYFGETIGRTTNRIKDAVIHNLNGKTYTLNANNGGHNLHGGTHGWNSKEWEGPKPISRKGKEGVMFRYVSPDGDEVFPGTVEARVWYVAWMEEGKTVLEVEYEVEFVGDECEETVVGVTNHSYFNLNLPTQSIAGTICTLGTTSHLEISADGIPTGRILPYADIPPTPHTPFTLSATSPDPDDCFIMNPDPASIPLDTRALPLKPLATLHHPATGLHLEIESTEPAFQFYAGRFLDVKECETSDGRKVPARPKRSGICVEPSRYVDCAGKEEWRGMCKLKRGEVWGSRSLYRAWKD